MAQHPPADQWADLARGLADRTTADRLHAHSLRCASCRRTLASLSAAAALARADLRREPPPEVVAAAIALFPPSAKKAAVRWPRLAGVLIFDSWQQPAMAGVRSQSLGERHMTFRSGEWAVDLRVEASSDRSISMSGQVVRAAGRGAALDGTPVRLRAGRRVVSRTALNGFGEFQIGSEAGTSDLVLEIPVSSSRVRLEIPVPATTNGARRRDRRGSGR